MNRTNHLLETLIWLKSKDATKKMPRNKPKPFVPEFMNHLKDTNKESVITTTDDIRDILARKRV